MEGHCHCKLVNWVYSLQLDSVTACNCTLCSRYGALWAYGFLDEGVIVSGTTSTYSRDRKINNFNFCSVCGCLTHYLCNSIDENGQRRIAVNLRMLADPNQITNLPIDHFDGKDTFDDLPQDGKKVHDLWF